MWGDAKRGFGLLLFFLPLVQLPHGDWSEAQPLPWQQKRTPAWGRWVGLERVCHVVTRWVCMVTLLAQPEQRLYQLLVSRGSLLLSSSPPLPNRSFIPADLLLQWNFLHNHHTFLLFSSCTVWFSRLLGDFSFWLGSFWMCWTPLLAVAAEARNGEKPFLVGGGFDPAASEANACVRAFPFWTEIRFLPATYCWSQGKAAWGICGNTTFWIFFSTKAEHLSKSQKALFAICGRSSEKKPPKPEIRIRNDIFRFF